MGMFFFFRKQQKVWAETTRPHPVVHPSRQRRQARFIGNRRYIDTPEAPYMLPKDLTDLNRQDFQHFILRYALGGNYIAPVPFQAGTTILDVGTGTGRWAIEMAEDFPAARVTGVDLEKYEELTGLQRILPANYVFQRANVLCGLPFADESFDFTHQRLLVMGIPLNRWEGVVRELLRVTRPGGWIEMVEGGAHILNHGLATARWFNLSEMLARGAGIDMYQISHLKHFAKQAGLPCEERTVDIPIGPWGGRLGTMMQTNLLTILEASAPRLQQQCGLSPIDLSALREQLVVEWETYHCQLRLFIVYGQRPNQHTVFQTGPLGFSPPFMRTPHIPAMNV